MKEKAKRKLFDGVKKLEEVTDVTKDYCSVYKYIRKDIVKTSKVFYRLCLATKFFVTLDE